LTYRIASSVEDLTPDSYFGSIYMDVNGRMWIQYMRNDFHVSKDDYQERLLALLDTIKHHLTPKDLNPWQPLSTPLRSCLSSKRL
jgi:hypothetical protein